MFGNPKDRFCRDVAPMVLETGEMARTLGQFDTLRKAPTQFGDKLLNNKVHLFCQFIKPLVRFD